MYRSGLESHNYVGFAYINISDPLVFCLRITLAPAKMEKNTPAGNVISERRSTNTQRDSHEPTESVPRFYINRQVLLAFIPLCILTLMVALEATSLPVALPVGSKFSFCESCNCRANTHV